MTVREQIINALDKFLAKCKNTFTAIANVVDNCASTSTTMPLSANQGKVLQDQITELNTDKIGFMYVDETLTCQAGTIREYAFSNLPTHRISFPLVINASNSIVGVEVFRNSEVNGGVKVYSPVAQNVIVRLLVFI